MFYSLLIIAIIIGLILGSFWHCLAWRLHFNQSLKGRSFCPHCHNLIHWYDNIPVFSWLFLGGKCRHCQARIDISHFLFELASGLLFGLGFIYLWQQAASELTFVIYFLAISLWLLVFLSDYLWLEVYLPPLFIGGAMILISQLLLGVSVWSLLLTLLIGVLFFGLQFVITKGRGIGSGDIYLGGLMGLIFTDWKLLLAALFLSYVFGAIVGLFLISRSQKNLKLKVPLGVFLSLGSILTLFVGKALLAWYLGLLF